MSPSSPTEVSLQDLEPGGWFLNDSASQNSWLAGTDFGMQLKKGVDDMGPCAAALGEVV